MKVDRKSIFVLLTLGFLFSCAPTPQQIVSEKPITPPVDSVSEKVKGSTVRLVSLFGTKIHIGSGFFVARDKIATNIHVVAPPGPIFAKLVDKKTVWAVKNVTAYDVEYDLVILKISGEGTPLQLGDSDAIRHGEPVSAVGFPSGIYKVMPGRVINTRNSNKRIQTTANTRGGNSGGPLLNSKKQVIGIHVGRDEAIPSNVLKALLSQPTRIEPIAQWRNRELIRAYAYFVLGKTKVAEEDYDEGMVDLNKALQLNPNFIYAYYARGIAKSNLGDYNGAIADYDKYIQVNSEDAEAYRDRAIAKFGLGDSKAEQGNTEAARSLYEAATEDYVNAIRLNPDRHHVYNYLMQRRYLFAQFEAEAGNMAGARKLYHEAIVDSEKAIQRDPDNIHAYHTRAKAKVALGDAKDAIRDFDKLIWMGPKFAKYYYERGRAKETLGQHEAAKSDFDKAKELDPDVGQ
ncbi:MAG: tetratricopeptide repeat-containing serine protease family protein [Candidatus Poribacteria bacterium]|nr:tetratricopeptide repeat-containing serine protease family protein [Candidatus Poribacteria bacterium]